MMEVWQIQFDKKLLCTCDRDWDFNDYNMRTWIKPIW